MYCAVTYFKPEKDILKNLKKFLFLQGTMFNFILENDSTV